MDLTKKQQLERLTSRSPYLWAGEEALQDVMDAIENADSSFDRRVRVLEANYYQHSQLLIEAGEKYRIFAFDSRADPKAVELMKLNDRVHGMLLGVCFHNEEWIELNKSQSIHAKITSIPQRLRLYWLRKTKYEGLMRSLCNDMEQAMQLLRSSIRQRSIYYQLSEFAFQEPSGLDLWIRQYSKCSFEELMETYPSRSRFAENQVDCLAELDAADPNAQDTPQKRIADFHRLAKEAVIVLNREPRDTIHVDKWTFTILKNDMMRICGDFTLVFICAGSVNHGATIRKLLDYMQECFTSYQKMLNRRFALNEDFAWEANTLTNALTRCRDLMIAFVQRRLERPEVRENECNEESCREALRNLLHAKEEDIQQHAAQVCSDCKVLRFKNITPILTQSLNLPTVEIPLEERTCDGAGSYADVYRVRWGVASGILQNPFIRGGDLAVKKVLQQRKGQFHFNEKQLSVRIIREVVLLSIVEHKNIVPLLGLCKNFQGLPYPVTVLPWMNGGNLTEFIARNMLTLRHKLLLMHDIASALSYLHGHQFKISHGDLRTDNILVCNGKAYLADFGVSTMMRQWGPDLQLDVLKNGNPYWLAPECLTHGMSSTTPPADMYSFGSVFYSVITLMPPFHEWNIETVILRRIAFDLHAPSFHPKIASHAHWNLMQKCWSISAPDRPSASMALEMRLQAQGSYSTFNRRGEILKTA